MKDDIGERPIIQTLLPLQEHITRYVAHVPFLISKTRAPYYHQGFLPREGDKSGQGELVAGPRKFVDVYRHSRARAMVRYSIPDARNLCPSIYWF